MIPRKKKLMALILKSNLSKLNAFVINDEQETSELTINIKGERRKTLARCVHVCVSTYRDMCMVTDLCQQRRDRGRILNVQFGGKT